MNEEPKGTYECPICGFDKPHTHDSFTLKWFDEVKHDPRYDVAWQRKYQRSVAEREHRFGLLKAEFDAGPRAYVAKYGSINSEESTYLVQWLLARIDRLEAVSTQKKETP